LINKPIDGIYWLNLIHQPRTLRKMVKVPGLTMMEGRMKGNSRTVNSMVKER